jgi:hypothetical protein
MWEYCFGGENGCFGDGNCCCCRFLKKTLRLHVKTHEKATQKTLFLVPYKISAFSALAPIFPNKVSLV